MAEDKDKTRPLEKRGGYQADSNPKPVNPPQGKKSSGSEQGKKK